ncbi:MAG TPA: pyridoxamine 5'-phosphate oxidase [Gammaproteobacteria bacterium]|nr:pyridoxamine 5'-phosphate oxidase [Gammaproteobacteria bacterium]
MQDDALYRQAVARFLALFEQGKALGLTEPAAMSLATVDAAGRPSVRTVLLKACDTRGFVFYTNKRSRKGTQIEATHRAALCFFWQALMQQVLVEGRVEDVSDAEADAYWATRPRESRIGAWASLQSDALDTRELLQRRYAEQEARFAGGDVPRPPHWSGYRVVPDLIEFWASRSSRLHERERYFLDRDGWRRILVYP